MSKTRIFSMLCVCFALGACVSANSGVLPIGPDTYQLSVGRAPVAGGPTEARKVALTQARQYCAQLGRELMVIGTEVWGKNKGGFDVDFRCLKSGDRGLYRPTLTSVPDKVIEVRRY